MTKNTLLLLSGIVLTCLFSSCVESSYFQSPLQGNSAAYHTMPVASDSVSGATYVNGSLSIGGSNQNWRDGVYKAQAGVQRANVLGNFRVNYGAALAFGSYNVKPYYDNYSGNYIDSGRNLGGKLFGAYGAFGGISAATRLGRYGEWRYIGIEGSLFNEFGSYANFRQHLPDSAAVEIDRKKYIGSLGINTELVFKYRSGNKFGIKIAAGSFLRQLRYNDPYANNNGYYYYHSHDDLIYFSNTYHFTISKATTWFHLNLATHAAHFQFGVNYRL